MTIKQELGSQLSPKTRLLLAEDEDFATTAARWNASFPINYSAVVDASCEEDVAATVKYANANGIPFLAFNGTHGAQTHLLKFKNGIGITTLAMKSLTINDSDGGRTAWIKGSWLSGHVRDELYQLGKRCVHGSCDSTGLVGPMLGGGHGFLQGRYGLLADQIVELRVVTADGNILTVSEDENADLFWAMRGAGHNFGIVTAMRYKVHDVPKKDVWSWSQMIFKGAQLEKLVPVFNQLLKNQPVEAAMWFPQICKLPQHDPTDPIIQVNFLYEGVDEALQAFCAPLAAMSPIHTSSKSISFLEASEFTDWGFSSISNQKGMSIYRFPVGAQSFSYTSMKSTLDTFSAGIAKQPAFAWSFVVWEAYATHAVKAVADEATAVADRADDMLVAAMIIMPPGGQRGLEAEAEKLGQKLRACLVGEGELHAYINYAHGDERLEDVYGHQTWRLEKLRRLKGIWDPENRFGFYSPII